MMITTSITITLTTRGKATAHRQRDAVIAELRTMGKMHRPGRVPFATTDDGHDLFLLALEPHDAPATAARATDDQAIDAIAQHVAALPITPREREAIMVVVRGFTAIARAERAECADDRR